MCLSLFTPAEVSLAEVTAGLARMEARIERVERGLAEMQRDRKRKAVKRERETVKNEAARKREAAKRDAELNKGLAEREENLKILRGEIIKEDKDELLKESAGFALWQSKRIGNIRLTDVHESKNKYVDGELCEYDIVAENGKMTVAMKVKHTLRLTDVRRFVKRLSLFDRAFPEMAEGKTVQGGMIYQTVRNREETVAEALKAGLLLLHAEGKKGLRQVKTVADSGRPAERGK